MAKRIQFALGLVFFALVFINSGVTVYQLLKGLSAASELGWHATQQQDRVVVVQVDPEGPAAALREGDEVVRLNGQPLRGAAQVSQYFQRLGPGSVYSVSVRRGGQLQDLTLQTEPIPLLPLWLAGCLILPAVFLATGLAVFLLKPYDKQALLLALMFGMFVGMFNPPYGALPWWLIALMAAARIVSTFFYPVFAHFFLIFPEPSPLLRRYPRLEFYLYLPHLLIILPFAAVFDVLLALDLQRALNFGAKFALLQGLGSVIGLGYVIAGFCLLYLNYRQASRTSRRKMRVVLAGSTAGFLPALLLGLLGALVYFVGLRVSYTLLLWLAVVMLFAFPLFPLSFAYAIIRHQVIPVSLIIRRGVRYLFVTQGSILLEVIAVFVVVTLLLQAFFSYLRTTSGFVVGVVSSVVAVAVWNITAMLHRRVVAPVIDRRFFRQSYNAQQILAELGHALRGTADLQEMSSLASATLQDALQTENVTVFLRDDQSGDYVCAFSTEYLEDSKVTVSTPRRSVLARDAFVVGRLRDLTVPLAVDFEDPKSWTHALASADRAGNVARRREHETLRHARAALLLPIATKSQLLGIVSLGPRLGDLPFSREDRQMLMTVAWQMALAIENTKLVQEMVREERLKRELETATKVQRRLFPERPPEVTGLDLAGVCYPASGVGGDYYDFLVLGNGQVGVAVADVAGKGISAAIVMSIVQASLRSQAQSGDCCLTDLVATMNRLLNESTESNNYATFFYAQFDEPSRRLTYVNAGHVPPILLRTGAAMSARSARPARSAVAEARAAATGLEVELAGYLIEPLTTGGLVIGLFDDCVYEQDTVELEGGDVLVACTDGVTEALNPAGEEFGEARLQEVVAAAAHLSAEELMQRIVDRVRAWCQDAPQHDDLTLVIMKVQ